MPAQSEGDLLLQACCAVPSDTTRHLVLADWLQEHEESELEAALRDTKWAEKLIVEVHASRHAIEACPLPAAIVGVNRDRPGSVYKADPWAL